MTKSEPTPPFAAVVRRRLRERGLGLREFCRLVDVDPSFFSKVLAGKRSPPSEDAVLRRIAQTLELEPCRLIVSAGRIPAEWARLWDDPPLLDEVRQLVAEAGSAAKPSGLAAHKPAAPKGAPAPQPPKPFGEELL